MHMGVDTSSVPSLQVPTGRRTGDTKGLNRRVPEEMTDRTHTALMQFRIQLVKQVRPPLALIIMWMAFLMSSCLYST